MLKPRLGREFGEPIKIQDDAFEAYNELLVTVDAERIAHALSKRACDLLYEAEGGIDQTIIKTAEKIIDNTNNGTQIGFGKDNGYADTIWGSIHDDPDHKDAARDFNALKYRPDANSSELESLCKKRGYHTLVAVARMHAMANQADTEFAAAA